MDKKNRKLYDYIQLQTTHMMDKWLDLRKIKTNSIYSKDAPEQIEQKLRKDNAELVSTISRILYESHESFEKTSEEWSTNLANDRVRSDTPIYETINNFKQFRFILWDTIEAYVLGNADEVELQDVSRWSISLNFAFDTVIDKFVKQYYVQTLHQLKSQQSLIEELSSPLIPITSDIGILPLIGEINTQRAKYIMDTVLQQASAAEISTLIIDLSGVSIVDTMVAHQLFQVSSALSLVGVESVITGIRPEVAQTSVQLGIDFSKVSTFNSLKQALKSIRG